MSFFRNFSRTVHIRQAQKGMSPEVAASLEDRARGKTTSQAFDAIARAMSLPDSKIYLRDHHGTADSDKMLFELTYRLIDHLGLQGFKCNKTNRTIVYSLDW